MRILRVFAVLTVAAGLVAAGALLARVGAGQRASEALSSTLVASLRACEAEAGTLACMQKAMIARAEEQGSPVSVMQALIEASSSDQALAANCHDIGHSFGRWAYAQYGTEAFSDALDDCGFGYYHGFLEGIGEAKQVTLLTERAEAVCAPFASTNRYGECIHGVGHAVALAVEFEGFSALCARMGSGDAALRDCYEGALMQWAMTASGFSVSDVPGLCARQPIALRSSCVTGLLLIQSSIPAAMQTKALCSDETFSEYAQSCWNALGAVVARLVTEYDKPPSVVALGCGAQQLCLRSAGYMLVAGGSMDLSFSRGVCNALEPDQRAACLSGVQAAGEYYEGDTALRP